MENLAVTILVELDPAFQELRIDELFAGLRRHLAVEILDGVAEHGDRPAVGEVENVVGWHPVPHADRRAVALPPCRLGKRWDGPQVFDMALVRHVEKVIGVALPCHRHQVVVEILLLLLGKNAPTDRDRCEVVDIAADMRQHVFRHMGFHCRFLPAARRCNHL